MYETQTEEFLSSTEVRTSPTELEFLSYIKQKQTIVLPRRVQSTPTAQIPLIGLHKNRTWKFSRMRGCIHSLITNNQLLAVCRVNWRNKCRFGVSMPFGLGSVSAHWSKHFSITIRYNTVYLVKYFSIFFSNIDLLLNYYGTSHTWCAMCLYGYVRCRSVGWKMCGL